MTPKRPSHIQWLATGAVLALVAAGAALGASSSGAQPDTAAAAPPAYRLHLGAMARDGQWPQHQDGYVTAAEATRPGSAVRVTATVRAETAGPVLVDVEIYGAGQRWHQAFYENQHFSRGQQRTYKVDWIPPANAPDGGYTVKIGVFAEGWSLLKHWNDEATSFVLE